MDELGVSNCDMKSELQAVCLHFTLCSHNPLFMPGSTFLSVLLIYALFLYHLL